MKQIGQIRWIQWTQPHRVPQRTFVRQTPERPFEPEIQAHVSMSRRQQGYECPNGLMCPPRHQHIVQAGQRQSAKRIIPREKFVAPVSGQSHRNELPCFLTKQICRQQGAVPHGFVQTAGNDRQQVFSPLDGQNFLMVLRLKEIGDLPRILCFIETGLFEADTEGFDTLASHNLGSEGRNRG